MSTVQRRDWTTLFEREQDIWVQNISTTQLSLSFEISPGVYGGEVIAPAASPRCLTDRVPFQAIKTSIDFRKMANRRPRVMVVLTREEADAYFRKRALQAGLFTVDPESGDRVPDIDAAREVAENEHAARTARRSTGDDTVVTEDNKVVFSPPRTARELMGASEGEVSTQVEAALQQYRAALKTANPKFAADDDLDDSQLTAVEPVHPRVIHICGQASMQMPAQDRATAQWALDELQPLVNGLNAADLRYIDAHVAYRSVRNWAQRELNDRMRGDVDEAGGVIEDEPPLDPSAEALAALRQ